jgi:hypothetical protein
MLTFLNYRKCDQLFMQQVVLDDDKAWPSVDGDGDFYSNHFISRKTLPNPPANVISFAHHQLARECLIKLIGLSIRHKIPRFENLLKKCHGLEFIPQ